MLSELKKLPMEEAIKVIHYTMMIINKYENIDGYEIKIDDSNIDLTEEQEKIANRILNSMDLENSHDEEAFNKRIYELYSYLEELTTNKSSSSNRSDDILRLIEDDKS